MRTAILSCVHANLPALHAALEHMRHQGVERVFSLGDIIGYGPQPRECLRICRGFALNLMGNHEEAVLYDAIGFNPKARAMMEFTKSQLNLPDACEENRELWNFIGGLPRQHVEDGVRYVHGSPRDPIREYVEPDEKKDTLRDIFAAFGERLCFVGHTHISGVITSECRHLTPAAITNRYRPDAERVIVNVGSVGQPHPHDPRGSYVIFDGEIVEFHRFEIEGTAYDLFDDRASA